ncbi:MAG TPA: alpha/beta hydrolase [Bryobacteraceae bacterium]|jgi:pimeloyl-ACP methyl ester carboxylesterase|nr:alpha/beta hydrolase [Bryobacteraceae bacterium]
MRAFPPPGRLVDIGGRRLHLQESGAGSPVVVLEAGIAATSLSWRTIQEQIAGFTRVVSYDRSGLGWSDPAVSRLTLAGLAGDLRALLTAAALPPPYILVAHSFGAFVVRAYSERYPEEIAGLVLVDPLLPEEWHPMTQARARTLDRGIRLSRRGAFLARTGLVGWCLQSLLGGARWLPKAIGGAASGRGLSVMKRLAGEVGKMPPEVWPMVAAHWSNPKSFLGMAAHFESLPEAAAELYAARPLAGIPVVALTSGRKEATGLERYAANLRHVIAQKSGHWIHLDEPELVVAAVRGLL